MVNGGKGHGAFLAANALLFIAALLWLFWPGVKDTRLPLSRWCFLLAGFFIFITTNLFTTVYLHASLIEWLRLVGYGTFFFILLSLAASAREKFSLFYQQAVWIVISVGVIESMIVLWQALQGKFLQGTMPNGNLVSGYIAFSFIFLLSFFVICRSSYKTKVCLAAMLFVMVSALALIHSRGVFLSLLVVLLLVFLKQPRILKFGSVILLFLLFIVVVNNGYADRFLKTADPYGYRRIAIWQSTLSMIKERPLAGWGLGNYGLIYPRYSKPNQETVLRYGKVTRFAHNEFLDLGATAGVPALGCFTVIVFLALYSGWKGYKKERSGSWLSSASFLVFLSAIVHSFVDFNLHLPAISYICILTAAYITTKQQTTNGKVGEPKNSTPGFRIIKAGLAAFYIVFLSVLGIFFVAYRYKIEAEELNSLRFPAHTVAYYYRQAGQYNSLDSYYHYELGRFYAKIFTDYQKVSFAEKALQEFNAASRLNPEESKIYQKAFYLCAALDLPLTKIQPLYQEAKEREPYYAQLSVDFAFFHMQKGLYSQAKELLKDAIRIEPNYLTAYYYLAEIHEREGHFPAAKKLYQYLEYAHGQHWETIAQSDYEKQALSVDWGGVFYRLGMLSIRAGRYEDAEKELLKALEYNAKNAEFYNALAGAYFQQGKTDLAKKSLGKAIALNPENAHLRKNLTFIK